MKKILSIIATSLLWVSSAEAGVPLVNGAPTLPLLLEVIK